jgi:hypothetical protein
VRRPSAEPEGDIEVTVVMRFPRGYEPEEEECRQWVEDQWMGTLLEYEMEDV